ncbi:MAG: hypothetical protein NT148_01635 [Candidatus Nealsonbacteria bacterium]|nr:hypothetical protein [Candidatus Nealsonbacteria bacterium]
MEVRFLSGPPDFVRSKLSKEQNMPTARILNEARIYGNRTVRAGDSVRMLPIKQKPKVIGEENTYNCRQFIKEWLGEGPYVVSKIGQWPCGKIVIYLKAPFAETAEEPWAPASDFI